mmetsp:Transcript_24031/g.60497  ORF Transcript_24031/g.60497 Transcript_24031/m.60497 type:complete len:278 (-) Transcript_24031:76-909(-)
MALLPAVASPPEEEAAWPMYCASIWDASVWLNWPMLERSVDQLAAPAGGAAPASESPSESPSRKSSMVPSARRRCTCRRSLWLALEYACCSFFVSSSSSSSSPFSMRSLWWRSSSTLLEKSLLPWSPGATDAWMFSISRSSDFILRKGQRLMPYLRHCRLSTVSPMPRRLQASSLGMWKHCASSSFVISDDVRPTDRRAPDSCFLSDERPDGAALICDSPASTFSCSLTSPSSPACSSPDCVASESSPGGCSSASSLSGAGADPPSSGTGRPGSSTS